MTVIPDPILSAVLVIPFLITYIALHFILFKPLYEYLHERDEASKTARREADELGVHVEERLSALKTKLAAARTEVTAHRAAARTKAQKAEAEIVAAARDEADKHVNAAVDEIVAARDQATTAMRQTAGPLSTDIVAQVLGRDVQAQA